MIAKARDLAPGLFTGLDPGPGGLDRKAGGVAKTCGGAGGAFAVLLEDNLFSGTGNDGTLTVNPVQSSSGRLATFKGNALAASPRYSFMLDETGVRAIDRQAERTFGPALFGNPDHAGKLSLQRVDPGPGQP
mgnify:CR=1 FL=1